MNARSVLVLVVAATLAGCAAPAPGAVDLATDAPASAVVPGEDVDPVVGDPMPPALGHDHADPAQHEVEVNMDLVAHPALDLSEGRFQEMDVQGDWLAQCTGNAITLWDVARADAPVVHATLAIERSCPDVKMTDDAAYLVAGGTQLWDIRAKDDPKLVAENKETGCHMCAVHAIGGKDYLFSAANGAGMAIAEIVREPPEIRKVAEWGFGTSCRGNPQPWIGNLRAPDPDCLVVGQFHDVYVYDDPLLNKTIAVPAYWDLGMWFVDVSDPAKPEALGHWDDYRGESGDIHTTSVDFLTVDGETRRIAVAATETGPVIGPFSTVQPSSLYVFDATDLGDIELLARWVNPGMRPSGVQGGEPPIVGEFSTHNIQFEHGRVYMAHYHAGVWVLDVQAWLDAGGRPDDTTHVDGDPVPVLGVYVTRGMDGEKGRSMVWDVVVHDGFVYASDETFGLFVLHFRGDPRFDPAWTSDA